MLDQFFSEYKNVFLALLATWSRESLCVLNNVVYNRECIVYANVHNVRYMRTLDSEFIVFFLVHCKVVKLQTTRISYDLLI